MKLADLFTLEPAPIYGQYVRRVVFDATPLPGERQLNPAREHRRAADRRYYRRQRAKAKETA